ncbi:hypothetical protein NL316_26260, partial [Klebsiella pneumoniae]|nr:hypothetical protein [Klebsiella pneumoniae]
MGPRSHLRRRLAYLPGTMVPPPSPVRLSAWDHGLTCIAGQVICLGPWSHFRRRSGYLPGTTVSPASPVRLSAWDHGPTSVVGHVICWDHGPTSVAGQVICLGPRSHFRRWSGYLLGPRS